MASAPAPASAPEPRAARLSRSAKIGLGLLLTLIGLFLISALLPTAPGALTFGITVGGCGILLLWLGGILMGIGSRS